MMRTMVKRLLRMDRTEREVSRIKMDVYNQAKQTSRAIQKTNKFLYTRSTTYFIAKATGIL